MDEREACERLRLIGNELRQNCKSRGIDCETCDRSQAALDHAIATIERVAMAPVVCPNRPGDSVVEALALMDFYEPDESPPYRRVRLVPDPQPDGQEGAT